MESSQQPVVENAEGPRRANQNGARGGIILILLGIVLLVSRVGHLRLHNWWALFILIPAIGSLESGWAAYRKSRRLDQAVWGGLYGAWVPIAVALIFLLDLSWARYWPVFLVLPGLGMLVSGLLPVPAETDARQPAWHYLRPWTAWSGLGLLLLGLGFAGRNLGWAAADGLGEHWWAWCLLLPAFGGVWGAISTWRSDERPAWAVGGQLIAAAVVALPAVAALSGWQWSLIGPLVVIAMGVVLVLAYALGRGVHPRA